MNAVEIIVKLRDRVMPTDDELRWFANGLATGAVSDSQAGAFAMAVLLNGMAEPARVALTLAMRDSGDVLRWDLPGPVVDKHSTGGVGDAVSLVLAPALAAAGAYVPMVSGRGLGHTGGTLDKMEAIPGLVVRSDQQRFSRIVKAAGCAIVGASRKIAPADKRLYAIRDVTGTVESIDLITASILSKKLAEGPEALVLDVKVGTGAFMHSAEDAMALAKSLVGTANGAGCRTAALITDMNEPLAPSLGNAVEVAASLEVLAGNRLAAPRLHDLTVALGGRLLALVGQDEGEAEEKIAEIIASGAAMERFARMVAEMGGPPDIDRDWQTHLPKAPVVVPIPAPDAGEVAGWNGYALGMTVVGLGGGRRVETDKIDPAVGLTEMLPIGHPVAAGDPLGFVHARTEADAALAVAEIQAAVTISAKAPETQLLHERIDS